MSADLRNVYLVVPTERSAASVKEAIQQRWPEGDQHFFLSDAAFLVKEGKLSTSAVADAVGFNPDAPLIEQPGPSTGFVFKLDNSSYSGFAVVTAWDWLRDVGAK